MATQTGSATRAIVQAYPMAEADLTVMTARRKFFKVGMRARIMLMSDQNRYFRGPITFLVSQEQMNIKIGEIEYLAARVPHSNRFREQGPG
jgi:hypothetical protein